MDFKTKKAENYYLCVYTAVIPEDSPDGLSAMGSNGKQAESMVISKIYLMKETLNAENNACI